MNTRIEVQLRDGHLTERQIREVAFAIGKAAHDAVMKQMENHGRPLLYEESPTTSIVTSQGL